MKFCQALSFTETTQLVALAQVCEEVGFEMAFLSDHLFVPEKIRSRYPYSENGSPPFGPDTEFPEAWAAISAMATATRRLRFTTAIYIAPLRHPLEVAKVEEARDTPTVEKLDIAVPPDRHSRPRKGLMSIAGSFLGFGFGFLWVVYKNREQ